MVTDVTDLKLPLDLVVRTGESEVLLETGIEGS